MFPSPLLARQDGLLAVGGDLSSERLLEAYRMGIFPWFSEGDPFLWWSPDPRLLLFPKQFHLSRSMKKLLRQNRFYTTFDQAFSQVIAECSQIKRKKEAGTWITQSMQDAYCNLHQQGFAHSVEVWQDNNLVGGLYGISLGRGFFGESMFSAVNNASKVALDALVVQLNQWEFLFIDCQLQTQHLANFGAVMIPRPQFLNLLNQAISYETKRGNWAKEKLFG